MMTKMRELIERREAGEKGFTLIELLVVIIIIGILAAVAIPMFMNQQKSAIDSATQSDVRNLATNVETLRVASPTAVNYSVTNATATSGGTAGTAAAPSVVAAPTGGGKVKVWLNGQSVDVTVSAGTSLSINANGSSAADGFTIRGWNPDGNKVGGSTVASRTNATTVTYNSALGGMQS